MAKRREGWQERTLEVKGKRKEYKRVYDLDKVQNKTEEERTNRLQKRKQDHGKQPKQLMNEQEYLKYYEQFFTQQLQMKMTKNQMSS